DAAFVHRGLSFIRQDGLLGAIINRTQFFKPALREWREVNLEGECSLDTAADLGYGVLDGALVEAAAYTLRPHAPDAFTTAIFFRLLKSDNKPGQLAQMVSDLPNPEGQNTCDTFCIIPSSFRKFPEARIAYWASSSIRKAFVSLPSLGSGLGQPQFGV